MDLLLKEAQEHERIAEALTFFERSYPLITEKKDHVKLVALGKFLKDYLVDHFKYEEEEIFPVLLEQGQPDEKQFVRSLQLDHVKILAAADSFFALLERTSATAGQEKFDSLAALGREVVSQTLCHATREDSRLFPMIQEYLS